MSVEKEKIFLKGSNFHGCFDFLTHEGEIWQPPNILLTESFLRAVYSHLLIANHGFMLHAAGIVQKNNGYVFFGPSGAGKSTVTNLSTGTILADEAIAVRKVNGCYYLFGAPFWKGKNIRLPLKRVKGLFALKKNSSNHTTRLTPSEGTRRLLSSLEFGIESPKLTKQLFATALEVLSFVPCYDLYFTKGNSFWDAIYEATDE